MYQWFADNLLLISFASACIAVFGLQYWWLHNRKLVRWPWTIWLLAAAILAYGGHQSRRAQDREFARVKSITGDFARLYARELEHHGHWKLPDDVAADDPLYLKLIELEKDWEKMNPDVSDIYTLRKRADGTNIFIVDSETDYNHNGKYDGEREQRTAVGEVYGEYDEGLEKAFRGEANFDFVPITDRWGTWVSSFVPLHDPSGRVEAVVGVDFDAREFSAAISGAASRVIGLTAVALVVLLGSSTLIAVLRGQIAERERTAERLRLLGSSVEQSRESIVITEAELDPPGPKIVFVNPAFTRITGYTAAEAIGKTPRILQGPRTDAALRKRLKEALARGEPFQGEAINYRKNGSEFFVEWDITPIRNEAGIITHFVSIQRDVTTRKKFEEQLFQSQKLETVAKLAGGVAHEFNNIMTSILGHCDLMLEDLPARSSLGANAQVIRKAAERAAALTRQLLAYARRQFLRPEKVSLNQIVAGMEDMIVHLMGGKIEVQMLPGPNLYDVFADAGQLEQVITNIVFNARDAMPEGGQLTLKTANVTLTDADSAMLSDLFPGNYVMLSIADTGKGMTDEVRLRLFEPFFSTKDIGKGTGLGLATCHGIIRQSGGDIAVETAPGKGTTFEIYLPQFNTDASPATVNRPAAGLPRGTETVLVVEDSQELLDMASILLRHQGYRVITATNGAEALEILRENGGKNIDLLFTDLVMPKMDGWELARRGLALHPEMKVLFCSAYTDSATVRQETLKAGTMLLQKPFTLSTLATKVRAALDGNNLR